MGVQIIENHNDFLGIWVELIGNNPHHFSPFNSSALIGDLDMPLSSQWLQEHKQIRYTASLVFIIEPFGGHLVVSPAVHGYP